MDRLDKGVARRAGFQEFYLTENEIFCRYGQVDEFERQFRAADEGGKTVDGNLNQFVDVGRELGALGEDKLVALLDGIVGVFDQESCDPVDGYLGLVQRFVELDLRNRTVIPGIDLHA